MCVVLAVAIHSVKGGDNEPEISADKARKGHRIPEFTLPERKGGEAGYGGRSDRGRYTLIQYGSSGCFFSLVSVKMLVEIKERYGDRFDLITVWGDRDRDSWLNSDALNTKELIAWTDLLDDDSVDKYFKIKVLPTFIVLGPDDEVIYIQKGLRRDRKTGGLKGGKLKKVLEELQ